MSHPLDQVPKPLAMLPRSWREGLFTHLGSFMFAKQFGAYTKRLTAAGLPPPPKNPLSKRPSIADGLPEALEQGRIAARQAITHVDGNEVSFTDGKTETIHMIVFATGYHLSYPYVRNEVLDTSNDDMSLFYGIMHPKYHSLFVVGVSRPTGAFWPIAEVQSNFIGPLLTGSYTLPPVKEIEANTGPILRRDAFNPALYGLALREELARGYNRSIT